MNPTPVIIPCDGFDGMTAKLSHIHNGLLNYNLFACVTIENLQGEWSYPGSGQQL